MFAVAFILQAGAQTKVHVWKEASSGGFTYKYVSGDATATRFYTLKNGLTVILSTLRKQPRIQCYIAVKAGSKTDPSDHTGLAHYLEHMMFKGTDQFGSIDYTKEKPLLDKIDVLYEKYNHTTDANARTAIYRDIDQTSGEAAKFAIANEYDKMIAAIGAQGSNAFTSVEQTVYYEDVPSTAIDQYLALQAERFRQPVFRIFHTELEAVYEEKNRGLDNDNNKSFESLMAGLFPTNKYGTQTTIGTVEHLKNPSLQEIRKYYNAYYVPNNIGIIMAGDFNPDEMIKKIDGAFSYMKTKPVPAYTFSPEKPLRTPVLKNVYGPTPENLMMGFRFPGAATADAETLQLLSQVLSNGTAGLIDLDLVKKQKILSASAGAELMKDYSFLYLTARPLTGQTLEQARDLLLAEITKLKNGEFDESLLTAIINNLKKDRIEQTRAYQSRANMLMYAFTNGEDWRLNVGQLERLSKITKKDLVAFANKYLGNNYVLVLKHKGEDKSIVKVDKPAITPVEVNREAQSAFLQKISTMPSGKAEPQWLDYKKDIVHGKSGPYEILSVKNADNALFTMTYHYKMGSWNNKLLPLAAQYIRFLGTNQSSAENISKAFYKLASNFDVSASAEETQVTISGLQENLLQTVSLVEDLIKNCKPDENALKKLKEQFIRNRENAKLNKANILSGLSNYAMYGAKNPFNYTLSNEELKSVTAAQLAGVIHDLARTMHTILYYGPQAPQDLAQTLEKIHQAPAQFVTIPEAQHFSISPHHGNRVLFADYDMVQAEIRWVHNGPVYNEAETPVINLFNNYYGQGMGAIVFQTLRESKALAYSTNMGYYEPVAKGRHYILNAYIGTQSDKFKEAAQGMNDLLNTFAESPKNLVIAKENIIKTLQTERITDEEILNNYVKAQRLGLAYDIRKNIYEKTQSMDMETVKNFFINNIKDQPMTYCIVASEKKVPADMLKVYGDFTKLNLTELFGF